jgi:class 3 adenylate cyclase
MSSAIVLLAAVLISLNHIQTSGYLVKFAERQMLLATDALMSRTEAFFQPVEGTLDAVDHALMRAWHSDQRSYPVDFFETAERRIATSPHIFNVFAGFPDGRYIRTGGSTPAIKRMAGIPRDVDAKWIRGSLYHERSEWSYLPRTERNWRHNEMGGVDFDPRDRAWYQAAAYADAPVWGDPLIGRNGLPVLTVSQAIYDPERALRGIVGVAVGLADLASFLAKLKPTENTLAFITRPDGRLIAHPTLSTLRAGASSSDLTINFSYDKNHGEHLVERSMVAEVEPDRGTVHFQTDEQTFIGVAHSFRSASGVEAVLYAGAPAMDFIGFAVRANYVTVALSSVVFLVTILLVLRMSQSLAAPIEDLARLAGDVKRKGVTDVPAHMGSFVREIDDAGSAFNAMVEGLREREMIRGLFGRFVPEKIAAELIKTKGALEPIATHGTVLFADIEGFTSMTERLGPSAVVHVLNEYFSAASKIIEAHRGVITQFQGDAIIAVYNVPVRDPRDAFHAVSTAMELLREVSECTYAGERLKIRIGISTGEVLAGNVGSVGRLTYTVHGDTVNLAARLEAMNKKLGTRILISADTRAALARAFRWTAVTARYGFKARLRLCCEGSG